MRTQTGALAALSVLLSQSPTLSLGANCCNGPVMPCYHSFRWPGHYFCYSYRRRLRLHRLHSWSQSLRRVRARDCPTLSGYTRPPRPPTLSPQSALRRLRHQAAVQHHLVPPPMQQQYPALRSRLRVPPHRSRHRTYQDPAPARPSPAMLPPYLTKRPRLRAALSLPR